MKLKMVGFQFAEQQRVNKIRILSGGNMFEGWIGTGILINVILSVWILNTLKEILKELKKK